MKNENPSPEKRSFLLYEKMSPNPRTVKIATAKGWKKVYGVRAVFIIFCSTGRMKTPCMVAIMTWVMIMSTPKILVLV